MTTDIGCQIMLWCFVGITICASLVVVAVTIMVLVSIFGRLIEDMKEAINERKNKD